MMFRLSRLRLRYKLALSLTVAALLPVLLAAVFAVRVVLRSLEKGIQEHAVRQARIAMNLVLRNVERLGDQTIQLSTNPSLVAAVDSRAGEVDEALSSLTSYLPSSWVQVADHTGRIVASGPVRGDEGDVHELAVGPGSVAVQRGLAFERRVTLVTVGPYLVVRASAPLVDESFGLHGVVVVSQPLDGEFADNVKGALGADVLFHADGEPAASSFLDLATGGYAHIAYPSDVSRSALENMIPVDRTIEGQGFTVAYLPVTNIEGQEVGLLGVAIDQRQVVAAMQAARQSLILGATGALLFALGLAALLSRRLVQPLARLHAGALAVARGKLDVDLPLSEDRDEIGDLARAFRTMTQSLRDNQERLAARMSEIVALHDAGRAISSVLDLNQVLGQVVQSMWAVLDTRLTALWLAERDDKGDVTLTIGVARARPRPATGVVHEGPVEPITEEESTGVADPLVIVAADVARMGESVRLDRLEAAPPRWRAAARDVRLDGSLMAVPLKRKHVVVGVLLVARTKEALPFSAADENLLETFADQAATAIENSRLYGEVRAFSEELEEKVEQRTAELRDANEDLARALEELREMQSQLLLSERLAGLGTLVAGVAHEINSPSAAIRGAIDPLSGNLQRLARRTREVAELDMASERRQAFFEVADRLAEKLPEQHLASPVKVRQQVKELSARLSALEIEGPDAVARSLASVGLADGADALVPFFAEQSADATALAGYVEELAYLSLGTSAIRAAIRRIQRIVGALKGYSHLDEARVETTDVHEGIENTLVILHHELKYGIEVTRRYGEVPRIRAYVDELNQVWTNLIQNAVQALGGKGSITIVTEAVAAADTPGTLGDAVAVRICDDGPGIDPDKLPRIFEPFYTTKAKGEGTGLGLGIVKKIVEKHGGAVEVDSGPGGTRFTIWLTVAGPRAQTGDEANPHEAEA